MSSCVESVVIDTDAAMMYPLHDNEQEQRSSSLPSLLSPARERRPSMGERFVKAFRRASWSEGNSSMMIAGAAAATPIATIRTTMTTVATTPAAATAPILISRRSSMGERFAKVLRRASWSVAAGNEENHRNHGATHNEKKKKKFSSKINIDNNYQKVPLHRSASASVCASAVKVARDKVIQASSNNAEPIRPKHHKHQQQPKRRSSTLLSRTASMERSSSYLSQAGPMLPTSSSPPVKTFSKSHRKSSTIKKGQNPRKSSATCQSSASLYSGGGGGPMCWPFLSSPSNSQQEHDPYCDATEEPTETETSMNDSQLYLFAYGNASASTRLEDMVEIYEKSFMNSPSCHGHRDDEVEVTEKTTSRMNQSEPAFGNVSKTLHLGDMVDVYEKMMEQFEKEEETTTNNDEKLTSAAARVVSSQC